MDRSIKSKIAASKISGAEATIKTERIRRNAAYAALTKAQSRGAGPDVRQRLAEAYQRAEERLEKADERARQERRKAAGLEPVLHMREEELVMLSPEMATRLRALGHGGQ